MRYYLFLFLSVFVFQLSFGQSISVSSFQKRNNDMDARAHYPVKDQNGDLCAMLKIETTETGFVFEGGSLGIMKTERKTAEYWVYVPYGSKRISIKHDQLGILRDYMFPETIDKATVYLMKLTTATVRTIVEDAVIESQWLIIKSEPTGANVFIDDQLAGTTPFQRKYKEDEYNYRIEKNRYHTQAGKLELSGEKVSLDVTLKPKFGDIRIASTPETGMQIYLDDENTGKTTPATLEEISSGEHNIKLQNQWYQPQTKVVTVEDEQTANLEFTMQPAFAELKVTASPDADILIDGDKKATGNWSGRLLSGIYTVKAEKTKYYSEEKQLEISAGKDEILSFELKGKTGSVDVITTPMEVNVYLDGEKQGLSPLTIKDKLIGNYKIKLEKDGYGIVSKSITVKEDETISINEALPQGKEITIASTPSGASISIDGENKGTMPYTGTLSFGSHNIKLVNGEKVVQQSITVTQTGKSRWEFDVQIGKKATIASTPSGASISIDGENKGTTPYTGTLSFGSHNIKLVNGEKVVQQSITITQTGKSRWEFDMGDNVYNPITGEIWMDRNLGASQVATSSTDASSYGDLYQWGRAADGHQIRTSGTTSTNSSTDNPGHNNFILEPNSPYDWRSPQNDNLWQGVSGTNNPCPSGYRLPTQAEWEAERQSWSTNNAAGAFASPLKLPVAGYRSISDGSLNLVGSYGYYWSSTVDGTFSRVLRCDSSGADMYSGTRAGGFSVRCLKEY